MQIFFNAYIFVVFFSYYELSKPVSKVIKIEMDLYDLNVHKYQKRKFGKFKSSNSVVAIISLSYTASL